MLDTKITHRGVQLGGDQRETRSAVRHRLGKLWFAAPLLDMQLPAIKGLRVPTPAESVCA